MKHDQEITITLGAGPPIYAKVAKPSPHDEYFVIKFLEDDPRNADGPQGQKRIPDGLRGKNIHVRP